MMTGKVFRPNRWGRLEQFQVPGRIFVDDRLSLGGSATATLMFLCLRAKGRYKQLLRYPSARKEDYISVPASQKELSLITGYSRNQLTSATRELVAGGWLEPPLQRRVRRGELGTNEYFLLDPKTRQRLQQFPMRPYFTVPACVLRRDNMHWSLRCLSSSEITLYTALLFRANQVRANTFPNDPILLRKMSNLSRGQRGPFSKAFESLQLKRLIIADREEVSLCDPLTGEPPVAAQDEGNDPANYFAPDGNRMIFNTGDPDALLRFVQDSLPKGEGVVHENDGEYKIRCPFHADRNPSLNFNPRKGIFHCFGCGAKGTIKKLVMKLTGADESEAILQHARAIGVEAVFEPDTKADAIYIYKDRDGNTLYRVLRYPGKRFSQQRWTPEGWVHNLNGVKRTLYNLPGIPFAATVVITEGEKDADRINSLQLQDSNGRRVIATTSGGADSWKDEFADLLAGPCLRIPANLPTGDSRCVIVMPDSDAPGQAYKNDIVASLKRRAIPHCILSFEGFKDVSDYLDANHSEEELAQKITDEITRIGVGAVMVHARKTVESQISV